MTGIKELFLATKALYEHVEMPLPKGEDEREEFIEKLNDLLAKREQFINEYSGNLAEQERPLANQIITWNKTINERMQQNLSLIKADINKLKQVKLSGEKYENPYDAQPDGFFIDKKK